MKIEARLAELGIELGKTTPPVGTYVPAVQTGNLLFVAGHGPRQDGVLKFRGKVGSDLTLEEGYQAARLAAINTLVTLKQVLGDLDRIRRFVRLFGMVNVAEGFTDTPKVIDGASDLIVEVFGDAGRHARSAVGMAALPFNIPVELEMTLELND